MNITNLMKKNLCFCFTGAILYLNWVIAKENVRLRRGVKVVKQDGGKKKQEWELCQTFLKENHAIKPQNQLIGRCYPWEFITGAWETSLASSPSGSRTRKDTCKGGFRLCVPAYIPPHTPTEPMKVWTKENQMHHSTSFSFIYWSHNSTSQRGGISHQLTLKLALMLKPCH